MNRSKLRAKFQEAGLEAEKIDEIVNFIMDENGKDINTAKNTAEDEFEKIKAENEALKKDKADLTTKIDGYKDYDLLKQFKAESDAKTEKQNRVDYLKSLGCKHPDLFEKQIDWSKASYDQEKKTYNGLDDTLKGLKESYADMFESKPSQPTQPITQKIVIGGTPSAGAQPINNGFDLGAAVSEHYGK